MQVTKGVKHAVILPWGDAYEPQWSAQQANPEGAIEAFISWWQPTAT